MDDFQDLILLECFSGDVHRQVFRVNHTMDKVEVLGYQFITAHEHMTDIQLDVVLVLKNVKGSSPGNEEQFPPSSLESPPCSLGLPYEIS